MCVCSFVFLVSFCLFCKALVFIFDFIFVDMIFKRCVNYFSSPVFKNGEIDSCTEGKMNSCFRFTCFVKLKKRKLDTKKKFETRVFVFV